MDLDDDQHRALVARLEKLLTDLDQLQLSNVAVHVDHALRLLETKIAHTAFAATDPSNGEDPTEN